MSTTESVRLATFPANEYAGEGPGTVKEARQWRDETKVLVSAGASYRPPEGWRIKHVHPAVCFDYTTVALVREEAV